MIAIQPEINYLVTGEWWPITGGKNIEAFTYIHIPLLLKVRFMNEGSFVPFVVAGPAAGFLLSAKENSKDVKSFFKTTDFGGDFGVGAELAVSRMKVILEARYYLGLTNAYSFSPDFSMKNRAIILTAGLLF